MIDRSPALCACKALFVNGLCGIGGVSTQTRSLAIQLTERGTDVEFYFYWDAGGRALFHGLFPYRMNSESSLLACLSTGDYDAVVLDLCTVRDGAHIAVKLAGYETQAIGVCHGCAAVPFAGSVAWPIVAVSDYLASLVSRQTGRQSRVVLNAIDTRVFAPHGTADVFVRPTVLWVGRSADPCKDYPGLAAASAVLAKMGFNILVIDGDRDSPWTTLGDWLGPRVTAMRVQSPGELAAVYRGVAQSGGFLLSTSKEEALGLAIAEAMACGCPVVAPRTGGIPEIVKDGVTGLLYDRENALDAICSTILEHLRSPSFRARVAANALSFVRSNLSADRMTDAYLQILDDVRASKRTSLALRLRRRLLCQATMVRRMLRARG